MPSKIQMPLQKLSAHNRRMLQSKLDKYAFSCGAELSDLELGEFPEVYIRRIFQSEANSGTHASGIRPWTGS